MAGNGLVARGEADHAVELRAFDLHLDVVRDQVAHRQDVVAAMAGAMDEVARRGGADLEWQAAGVADRVFHDLGDAVEMAEADGELRRRVHHRDFRLLHVRVGQPERRHCARRTAQNEVPGWKLLRSFRVMSAIVGLLLGIFLADPRWRSAHSGTPNSKLGYSNPVRGIIGYSAS